MAPFAQMTLQQRREWLMRCSGTGMVLMAIGLVAVYNLGCGGPKRPMIPVKGRVVFEDGTPLPAGTRIILEPMEGDLQAASGETGQDGSFSVQHATGKLGAEVGKYRVRFAAPKGDQGAFLQMVPDSYLDGQETYLEVKQGMGEVTLKVKRRQAAS